MEVYCQSIGCMIYRMSPDGFITACVGALTLSVLGLQMFLIWRTYQVAAEAEKRSQRHDKLSVRPYLDFDVQRDGRGFSIKLHNHGAGVGLISELTLWADGRLLTLPANNIEKIFQFVAELGLPSQSLLSPGRQTMNHFELPSAIGPGKELLVLDLQFVPPFDSYTISDRIGVRVSYISIYEDEVFYSSVGNVEP